ncbi:MAG: Guanosine-5'-triphosphate,3'-diphosphate pyrophosphatase [Firmicutes bacterium ADurb.Bin506]|nr:MAG: Guanosine-5'-triphosphate,3'-diphosphate pyrophosphatase [Firmicutes bacterium ADurb.Bin506]
MSTKAVIDIGTNSIKLFVAELGADGVLRSIADTNNIARLGEGMGDTGMLQPEAMARNAEAVAEFAELARAKGASEVIAVGTMALRTAKNTPEFVAAVRARAGIDVQVIPGEQEAELAYLAVLSGLGAYGGALVICDVGGGSSEFVFGQGDAVTRRFSINLGAVKVTERFLKSDPPSTAQIDDAVAFIMGELEAGDVSGEASRLVGIGGTVTSMGAVKLEMAEYDADRIQGAVLTAADIDGLIEMFSSMPLAERKKITGLQPKRAEVIIGGACIIKCIMRRLNLSELVMSDRGLRHGLMYKILVGGQ